MFRTLAPRGPSLVLIGHALFLPPGMQYSRPCRYATLNLSDSFRAAAATPPSSPLQENDSADAEMENQKTCSRDYRSNLSRRPFEGDKRCLNFRTFSPVN